MKEHPRKELLNYLTGKKAKLAFLAKQGYYYSLQERLQEMRDEAGLMLLKSVLSEK